MQSFGEKKQSLKRERTLALRGMFAKLRDAADLAPYSELLMKSNALRTFDAYSRDSAFQNTLCEMLQMNKWTASACCVSVLLPPLIVIDECFRGIITVSKGSSRAS